MKTKANKSRYLVTAFFCLMLGIVLMGQSSMYWALSTFIKDELELSYTQTSIVTTCMNLGSLTATFLIAALYNKMGVKKGLIVPVACATCAWILYGMVTSFPILCLAGFLNQFAFGLGGMMPASLIINRWFVKQKGLVLGITSAGSGITSMLFSRFMAVTAETKGVSSATILVAIAVAVCGVLIILFTRNTPEEVGLTPYGADEGGETKQTRKKDVKVVNVTPVSGSAKYLLMLAVVFCGFTGFQAIPNFNFACTSKGFDPVFVATLSGFTGALAIGGKPFFGFLIDKVGAVKANMIYMGLAVISYILLAMARPGSEFLLYIVVIIFGIAAYSITTIGVPIWAAELFGEENYSKNLKNLQLCSTGGGLICAPFPGIIADATGNYDLFFLLLAVSLVAALVIITVIYGKYTRRVTGE